MFVAGVMSPTVTPRHSLDPGDNDLIALAMTTRSVVDCDVTNFLILPIAYWCTHPL